MSQQMIVWCTIAGVLLLAFMFRAFGQFYTALHHNGGKQRHHLFELGKEKEMFFIPGDADDDDDEDL